MKIYTVQEVDWDDWPQGAPDYYYTQEKSASLMCEKLNEMRGYTSDMEMNHYVVHQVVVSEE